MVGDCILSVGLWISVGGDTVGGGIALLLVLLSIVSGSSSLLNAFSKQLVLKVVLKGNFSTNS